MAPRIMEAKMGKLSTNPGTQLLLLRLLHQIAPAHPIFYAANSYGTDAFKGAI
jgi:hypothetical protein